MEFEEWLRIGRRHDWCSPTVCYTHEGLPTSPEEDIEFEDGDPCIHIIRLYEDTETKHAVENNFRFQSEHPTH